MVTSDRDRRDPFQVRTLEDILVGLARWPDAPAVISFRDGAKQVLTYRELDDLSRRLAAGLVARGVALGEPVGIYLDNRPQAVVARLALIAAGAVILSLDPDLRPAQLARAVEDSACRRVFTTGAKLSELREAGLDGLDAILLDDWEDDSAAAENWRDLLAEEPMAPREISEDMIAAFFYTSGTTGRPKGVPLSHGNIAGNLAALLDLGLVAPEDRVLLPLPLHHSYPFIVGMLVPLAAGAAIVMPAEVTGAAIQSALRDTRTSIMIGVPRLYEALYAGIEGQLAARGRLPRALFRGLLQLSIRARRGLGVNPGRRLFAALHRRFGPSLRAGPDRLRPGGDRVDRVVQPAGPGPDRQRRPAGSRRRNPYRRTQ
jgi:long-chain acyl-CoA synthetase